jgi:hypothetical protein
MKPTTKEIMSKINDLWLASTHRLTKSYDWKQGYRAAIEDVLEAIDNVDPL